MLLSRIINVMRLGAEVSNAEAWKRSTVVASLAALLIELARIAALFGWDLGVDDAVYHALAGGIVAVVSVFTAWSTLATSRRVGLPPVRDRDAPPDDVHGV